MAFSLVFLMLAINIRAGVYIAIATRFPDKYDVIIHCVSHIIHISGLVII